MSLHNFKPTIWSKLIVDTNRKRLVYGDVANRNYEGEIANGGEKVKILSIGDVNVNDYTTDGSITWQTLTDSSQYLEIDQQKYFAISVDDVDKAQANADVIANATEKAGYKIADTADQFLAGLYAGAGVTSSLGTTASPLTIGASNTTIPVFFGRLARALGDANCPRPYWCVVPPWMEQEIIKAQNNQRTDENAETRNGRVGQYWGFDIRVSTNVQTETAGAVHKIMAGNMEAISYAEQLVKVVAVDRHDTFAEGVKGLHVYGGKVVKADCLAVASVSEA